MRILRRVKRLGLVSMTLLALASGRGRAVADVKGRVPSSPPEVDVPVAWATYTSSPQWSLPKGDRVERDRIAQLLAHCGRGDAGLEEVARRIVADRIEGESHLDLAALTFSLRAAGEPHVWPHAWVLTGKPLDREGVGAKLDAWSATFHDEGDRRCGVATGVAKDGTEILAAVALDALADLAPLPTEAHVGTWLTVDAQLVVPAEEARVIVQGPGSDPRAIPTWIEEDGGRVHVRARFTPDRTGPITVQVVADVATGPRPVLEARVFADVAPPERYGQEVAPGEDARVLRSDASSADRLLAMVSALRDRERLPGLARDAKLDTIALTHARRMLAARTVGHDLGDGDPGDRVARAGVRARLVGENVAHAATVKLAHRALYASPSHRENLLREEFGRVGVAVVDDPDGSVWVAEVFAD